MMRLRLLDFERPMRSSAAALGSAWLLWGSAAYALEPHTALTQYGHRAWHTTEGLPQNSVQAMPHAAPFK